MCPAMGMVHVFRWISFRQGTREQVYDVDSVSVLHCTVYYAGILQILMGILCRLCCVCQRLQCIPKFSSSANKYIEYSRDNKVSYSVRCAIALADAGVDGRIILDQLHKVSPLVPVCTRSL